MTRIKLETLLSRRLPPPQGDPLHDERAQGVQLRRVRRRGALPRRGGLHQQQDDGHHRPCLRRRLLG